MKKIHLGGKPPQRGVDITIEILTARKPPELLWYAADEKEAVRIRKKGLRSILVPKILYETAETARKTGKPCLFCIRAGELYRERVPFFVSNAVWSCPRIKPAFLDEIT